MTPITPICVITGAAQGIGQAIAKLLIEQGQAVALLDKNAEALDRFVNQLSPDAAALVTAWQLDLCDSDALLDTLDQIENTHGPITQLAHAAGILRLSPITKMDADAFQQLMDIHVSASFHLLKRISELMIARKQGAIVVIGSNGGATPRMNMGGYCASKAALHMLAQCFALELAPIGIRCNIVSPGSTRTEMQSQMWHEHYQESHTIAGNPEQFRLGIPLNKIAEPDDIAKAAQFLLSDNASHITMHDLRVDGGATLDQG